MKIRGKRTKACEETKLLFGNTVACVGRVINEKWRGIVLKLLPEKR